MSVGNYLTYVKSTNGNTEGWIIADLGKNWLVVGGAFDNNLDEFSITTKMGSTIVMRADVHNVSGYENITTDVMHYISSLVDRAIRIAQGKPGDIKWADADKQEKFELILPGSIVYIFNIDYGLYSCTVKDCFLNNDDYNSYVVLTKAAYLGYDTFYATDLGSIFFISKDDALDFSHNSINKAIKRYREDMICSVKEQYKDMAKIEKFNNMLNELKKL